MTNAGVVERGFIGGAKNSMAIFLDLTDMTRASCVNRIEKKLSKVDGVQATVNYTIEKARVQASEGTTAQDLVAVVETTGYGARETTVKPREERANVPLLWVQLAFILAVPMIAISMVPALQLSGQQRLALLLTAVAVFWCGRSFHRTVLASIRYGATTVDTLVSLSTSVAWLWPMVTMFSGHVGTVGMTHEFMLILRYAGPMGNVYFGAAAGVVAFLLLGYQIEVRPRQEVGSAVRALLEVGAKKATILRDGAEVAIPAGELSLNDLVMVRPGGKVATSRVVVEGSPAVDAVVITDESLPMEVGPGSVVVDGSVNTTGCPVAKAAAIGLATQVTQITRLVEEVQTDKARVQRLTDRITKFFVSAVLMLSMLTFMVQLLVGASPTFTLTAGMAVLIIACSYVLGLATPLALLVGAGHGAEPGVIIRGAQALGKACSVRVVVLDKTGILTIGRMSVLEVALAESADGAELLAVTAAVEAGSEYPIAHAVMGRARGAPAAERFEALPDIRTRVLLDGVPVTVGSRRLLAEQGIKVSGRASREGNEVFVVRDGALLEWIAVGDQLKPGAAKAVVGLGDLGLRPMLLTGDPRVVAREVVSRVNIEDVHAKVLSWGRAEVVARLQADGVRVAMVDDGANSAAVLATSDFGIVMGAGTNTAVAANDLTLMRNDLMGMVGIIQLSRVTERTIRGNLLRAFFYNAAVVPVAALGLLTLMIAGTAMACSSAFVILNFLRLCNFRQGHFLGSPRIPPISPENRGVAVKPVVTSRFNPWEAGVNEDLFPVGKVGGYNRATRS